MRYSVSDYIALVGRDRETDEHVAVLREFPSLSWVAASRVDAAAGLRALLRDVLDDMYAHGEDVPSPQPGSALANLQSV